MIGSGYVLPSSDPAPLSSSGAALHGWWASRSSSGARRCDLAIDIGLWRVVRIVLLRDVRSYVAVAAEALDLAGRGGRCVLGIVRNSGVVDRRAADCQLARAENLTASRPAVIAKQSIPRSSYLDCFAEPVIGRRGACHRAPIRATRWRRPAGSQ